nr:unnamed protein product [Digitaria exilis]
MVLYVNRLAEQPGVTIDAEHGVVGDHARRHAGAAHGPEEPVRLAREVELPVRVQHDVEHGEVRLDARHGAHVREERHDGEVPAAARQRGEDGGVGLGVGRDAVGGHVVEQQPLGVAEQAGLAVRGDGGVVGLEVRPDPRAAQPREERERLGPVAAAEGEVDEVGEEDEVRGHGVVLHERQEGERVVQEARAGERGEERGVGEGVGGHAPVPHLEEEPRGEAEVAGAAGGADEQVVGDEERGGREVRREEVEQRDAAARVAEAGEERAEEATGDGAVRGERGGQVRRRPRGGER